MKEYISENYKCKCFFSLSRALLLVIDKYDWFQTLLGQNSCLSDLVYLFSLDCPVAALWLCACICDVALRQGCYWRLADVEMQLWAHVRVCGGFYCSLSCVVDTHTVIQPWVSRQTQTPTVGWDRQKGQFCHTTLPVGKSRPRNGHSTI